MPHRFIPFALTMSLSSLLGILLVACSHTPEGTQKAGRSPSFYQDTLTAFCQKPYETICGHDEDDLQRTKRLEEYRTSIKKQALLKAAQFLSIPKPDSFTEQDLEKIKNKKKRRKANEIYNEDLWSSIESKIGRAHGTLNERLSAVQKNLRRVLKAVGRFPSDNPQQERDSQKMRAILDRIELVFASDIFDENLTLTDKAYEELVNDFYEGCGDDGLEDNAFANSYDKTYKIVICPGALIATIDQDKESLGVEDSFLVGLLMTLAHEAGHHFDSQDFPNIYTKQQQCMKDHYESNLDRQRPIENFMREIAADYWGAEYLAHYMREIGSNDVLKLTVLKRSLEDLCASEQDAEHPSGRFRIENLVRRNPEMHHALGCTLPSQENGPRSCTLNGETHKVFWMP